MRPRISFALIALLTVMTAMIMAFVGQARAACAVVEAPLVVWSFPTDGDTAPPNALFWVITDWGAPHRVRIEGVGDASRGEQRGSFVPPPLAPSSAYTLVVERDDTGTAEVRIPFETSAEPARDVPDPPSVRGHTHSSGPEALGATCEPVLWAIDCFDQGQDRFVSLDVEGDALLWLVRVTDSQGALRGSYRWPASCGGPWFLSGSAAGEARLCFDLVAVGSSGEESSASRYCTSPPFQPDEPSGCTEAPPALGLVGLGLLGLLPRRTRRRAWHERALRER